MQFNKYRDVVAGAVFLVVAAILYLSSFSIITSIPGRLGAEFMPQVVAWVIAILSVILIISGLRPLLADRGKEAGPTTEAEREAHITETRERVQVLLMLAVVSLYIMLIAPLGFVFSSMLFLFAMMVIMSNQSKQRYWLFALIAIFASVAIYYLFRVAFHLYLPAGIYPF